MIDELRNKSGDRNLLENFADTLESHIRFEERELFNHLQQNISDKDLTEIASSAKPRNHEPVGAWNDIFWDVKK